MTEGAAGPFTQRAVTNVSSSPFQRSESAFSTKARKWYQVPQESPVRGSEKASAGEQIGVVLFDGMVTCNRARDIILGLDRQGKSKTAHIYVLDEESTWGQSCKETNGKLEVIGTRDPRAVTNYLVFY